MFYLFPSKLTEMHIATKTNETNTNNNSFKEAKCRCNRKAIIEKSHFQVFYILLYIYSSDEAKSVLNVTKSQH